MIKLNKGAEPLLGRFHRHVARMPNGCWLWEGATTTSDNVPVMRCMDKNLFVRQYVAYEINGEKRTPGLWPSATCGNPLCVAPGHVKLMTRLEIKVVLGTAGSVVLKKCPKTIAGWKGSLPALARKLGVSRHSILRAYKELGKPVPEWIPPVTHSPAVIRQIKACPRRKGALKELCTKLGIGHSYGCALRNGLRSRKVDQ